MTRVASFHLATFPLRRSLSKFISVPAERWELSEAKGCVLGKVLATSRRGTTRFSTDVGRWSIFAVWEDEVSRAAFLKDSPLMQRWEKAAISMRHLMLEPIASNGLWNGIDPFPDLVETRNTADDAPIAVITRATVRPGKALAFTRSINVVDDALRKHEGCTLALGVGQWPVIHQATFSVWDSAASIRAFAYEGKEHAAVIKRRHEEDWFTEELFTRFRVSADFA